MSSKSEIEEAGEEEGEQKIFPASVREGSPLKARHGNPTDKLSNHQPYLDLPLQSTFARSSATFSDLSTYSADNETERRTGRLLAVSSSRRLLSRSPAPSPRTWKQAFRLFWARNKGLSLVMLSQLFGVMMNVTIRLLEMNGTSGPGMHPFQVLPAVPLTSLPEMLGASLTMIDPIRSDDRHSHTQRHLSMVGQSRWSTFRRAGNSWALDCTWDWWVFRR